MVNPLRLHSRGMLSVATGPTLSALCPRPV
jgi:hypothetical protein